MKPSLSRRLACLMLTAAIAGCANPTTDEMARRLAREREQKLTQMVNDSVAALRRDLERSQRRERLQADAQQVGAAARKAPEALSPALAAAYQKPVSLEFRNAELRQVFETLARSTGINFVFDKDVRGDARITVFLQKVSLDEALRVILATQQLDRKLLNDTTVLVFPNTQAKQREHQELVTRSFYLTNADPKQAMAMVRTLAKTRDMHVDERLNLLIVRDTPEVVRLIERLMATIDLPEPEVTLDVQVMEVASDRLDELGLQWPTEVQWGIPNATGQVTRSDRGSFRVSIANPALVATLNGSSGWANLLANPTIRARNHEKAKVQIGEKLPVFTTTSTANVGVSTSVSYLDVGLKLDVEPAVQLDDEVTIKVGLEVSSLLRQVSGPAGAIGYQLGTRLTSTSLRLKDGETQVLAGLINDEDRKSAVGVPGLSSLPVVGRLFGVHTDTRNKTEIVLLITPHIVRNLPLPDAAAMLVPSGTDASPGTAPLRVGAQARVGVGAGSGTSAPAPAAVASAPAAPRAPALLLAATSEAGVGDTVSVTLTNQTAQAVRGELEFDPSMFQPAQDLGAASPGHAPFEIGPRGDFVLVLRVLPAAAGTASSIGVTGLSAVGGGTGEVKVEGEATVVVRAENAEPAK